ncbi:MAG: class D beta-lactamase [Cyclobacteriaceae bacterium]|nr:class D beta-lactamase [Cyclobacteriaceae bacterium]
MEGCFILCDLANDTTVVYNAQRAEQPFLPASTFKILNSLIALETGAVQNADESIEWDGEQRFVQEWNRDHTMRSAMQYSVVWFYQELARRIGEGQMHKWVDAVGYGNTQTGKNIDDFWLVGDLRITPRQQVEFLKKLVLEKLPFSRHTIGQVKDILIEDKTDRYIFRAKSGWATQGQHIGWYIGYIEIDGKAYIFVNNIDINSDADPKARKEIAKEIFKTAFDIDLDI